MHPADSIAGLTGGAGAGDPVARPLGGTAQAPPHRPTARPRPGGAADAAGDWLLSMVLPGAAPCCVVFRWSASGVPFWSDQRAHSLALPDWSPSALQDGDITGRRRVFGFFFLEDPPPTMSPLSPNPTLPG